MIIIFAKKMHLLLFPYSPVNVDQATNDVNTQLLKDLFEIRVGLVDNHREYSLDGDSIEPKIKLIQVSDLLDIPYQKTEKLNKEVDNSIKKVPYGLLLEKYDYLIQTRGKISGHRGSEILKKYRGEYYLVPSHHFIILRPRRKIYLNEKYFHFVLDLIVNRINDYIKEQKTKDKKILYLTVKMIGNIAVTIPDATTQDNDIYKKEILDESIAKLEKEYLDFQEKVTQQLKIKLDLTAWSIH